MQLTCIYYIYQIIYKSSSDIFFQHFYFMTIHNQLISDADLSKLCPCGRGDSSDFERIPRTTFMKTILFWSPIRHYRCYACMRKRWIIMKLPK